MAMRSATQEEKAEILERTRPFLRQSQIDDYVTEVISLPFYPATRLIKLITRDSPIKKYAFVFTAAETFRLDHSPGQIQACNAAAPLVLSEASIHAYIKFCYFYGSNKHIFESKIRRSAVGYSGKIWVFEKEGFFETDINISMHGTVTELEKTPIPDVPEFDQGDFSL